jgi:iron complex outermembrane receptor protein
MKSKILAGRHAALAAVMSCPLIVQAQEAEPAPEIVGLGEVIVTAQKRQQSLQDVPLSVSAFSGESLKEARMSDIRGLVDFTPGFSGKTEDGFTDALAMRGIATNDFGIGGDPSVAMFIDGIWAGRTGGVVTSFYDIERAEVVKGPQGTLFGRNSIAGAVSIITNRPQDHFEASAELTIADHETLEGTGTINLPLSETVYFRASGYAMQDDGFLDNTEGGDELGFHDIQSGRVALRFAGETVDATFTASYEDREQDPSVYWVPAAGLPEDLVSSDLGDDGFDKSEVFDARAIIEWSLPSDYTLTSLTGYKPLQQAEFGHVILRDRRVFRVLQPLAERRRVPQNLRERRLCDGRPTSHVVKVPADQVRREPGFAGQRQHFGLRVWRGLLRLHKGRAEPLLLGRVLVLDEF